MKRTDFMALFEMPIRKPSTVNATSAAGNKPRLLGNCAGPTGSGALSPGNSPKLLLVVAFPQRSTKASGGRWAGVHGFPRPHEVDVSVADSADAWQCGAVANDRTDVLG